MQPHVKLALRASVTVVEKLQLRVQPTASVQTKMRMKMTKETLSEKVRRKLHQQVVMRVQEEAGGKLLAQMAMQLHEEVRSEETKMLQGGSQRQHPA